MALVANLAETTALASALDVDHGVLLDLLAQTPVGSPYAGIKGELMRSRSYPVSFALDLAAKDLELVTEARELLALDGHLADATRKLFEQAKEAGLGSFDLSAVYEVCAPAGERRDQREPHTPAGVRARVPPRSDNAEPQSPRRAETAEAGGDDSPAAGTLAL
ncbi:3-sulfolactaldehyde reductase [bacterium HR41]|nr:3-sulfolactaldehyde reductase [bacterium HR41]